MALAWNRDEIEDMRRFAEELGVPFRYDGLLNARVDLRRLARGRADSRPWSSWRWSSRIRRSARSSRTRPRTCGQLQAVGPIAFEQVYTCGAGQVSFTVDPYGRMQMCQLSRKASFDLAEERFQTVWDERFSAPCARAPGKTDVACRTCTLQPLCGSCPGAAELVHGTSGGAGRALLRESHTCARTR
jgi:radical SAM protein with 4Fe4S-binding SPASM domain